MSTPGKSLFAGWEVLILTSIVEFVSRLFGKKDILQHNKPPLDMYFCKMITLYQLSFLIIFLNILLVPTAEKIRIWRKGVDSVSFHPRFRSSEMRMKLRSALME